MAWRFTGRARASRTNPSAFAACDRCGMWHNLSALRFQFEWRGNTLMNLNIRVCSLCYDKPFEHYRPIIVPPDPVPAWMPRPDQYAPLMPYALTDTQGRALLDTAGNPLYATSQTPIPQLNGATVPISGYTTAQQADGYALESPDGGMVFLIPD